MELARLLKTKYSSLRSGWRQFLRLRGLATIQFVQVSSPRTCRVFANDELLMALV
jgi:hypothetical protein